MKINNKVGRANVIPNCPDVLFLSTLWFFFFELKCIVKYFFIFIELYYHNLSSATMLKMKVISKI